MARFLRPWHILTLALAVGAAALVPALGGHDHSTVAASARTNRAAFHDGMRGEVLVPADVWDGAR